MDQLFGRDSSQDKKKHKKKTNNKKQQNKEGQKQQNTNQKKQQKANEYKNLNAQKKQRKDRAKNKKGKKDQKKEQSKKEQLQIPMIIKLHHSIEGADQQQKSLQDFIDYMYPDEKKVEKGFHKIMGKFQEENDEGSIQYKLKLINPTDDRIDHLATQMKFRIGEGSGQACYRIGVEDDGRAIGLSKQQMYQSLKTICTLAKKVQADVTAFKISQGLKGNIVELLIRKNQKQGINFQIRLLLVGQPGSGKSTLLGVLKSGQKDDGKGSARTKVFIHKDEFMSGTTQTKSHQMIAFDSKGKLNVQQPMTSVQTWLQNSSKILSFIDVGGHKEKQVVSSLCSFFPQYALWVVSGQNKNISKSSLELPKIFNLPLIVVISHMDKLDFGKQKQAERRVKKILGELYPKKTPSIIKDMQLAVLFSRITASQAVIPIFPVSSVSGQGIELLINFFNLLTSVNQLRNNEDMHSQFLISYKYLIDNKIVLAGTVIKGIIKNKQILHLGPDPKGSFRAVQVESIQCMRVPVTIAKCGQVCTIAIRPLIYAKQWLEKQPNAIRRGMILIQSKSNPKATYQFCAQFMLYGNDTAQTKITAKYQPVINTLTTRQICDIIVIKQSEIKQEQMDSLKQLTKKKSRSIDNMLQKHHNKNMHSHSVIKNLGNDHEKQEIRYRKQYRNKSSVDLTIQTSQVSSPKQTKLAKLQTIKQKQQDSSKIKKKKKQRDMQIKFTNQQPTTVRLRFKYNPEYLEKGQRLVINELKLIGRVTEIYY